MTYCIGYWLQKGLVMASDSRTSAGVDYISSYSKMHRIGCSFCWRRGAWPPPKR
jgi:predicted proteasome-type protease